MYDGASPSDAVRLQRAVGELRVSFKRRSDATVLDGLRQAGCLKARFPRAVVPGWADVVTLNTSGGIASGDRLDSTFGVNEGAHATIAAQAAERFYRAYNAPAPTPAFVRTRIDIAPGGAAEWLPQETILFDRCAVDRRLEVDIAGDGWFLGVECVVFGRAAMGEQVAQAWLRDVIRIRHDGRLLLHDALRCDGDVAAVLAGRATAGGARALATLVHVGPAAEQALEPVRAALAGVPDAAASAWNNMLLARILAPDSAALRLAVTAVLAALRGGRPLPRTWLC